MEPTLSRSPAPMLAATSYINARTNNLSLSRLSRSSPSLCLPLLRPNAATAHSCHGFHGASRQPAPRRRHSHYRGAPPTPTCATSDHGVAHAPYGNAQGDACVGCSAALVPVRHVARHRRHIDAINRASSQAQRPAPQPYALESWVPPSLPGPPPATKASSSARPYASRLALALTHHHSSNLSSPIQTGLRASLSRCRSQPC